jgi:hypothetical protein
MILGEIDRVGSTYVGTKFFALSIPVGSMYVTNADSHRSGNVTTMTWQGVPIPIVWKSALLGILRVWPWFLGFAWPFATHWEENVSSIPTSTWLTSVAFFAVALLSLVPGRLSPAERGKLEVLRTVTGMALDPRRLGRWTREGTLEQLRHDATRLGLALDAEAARAALAELPHAVLPHLYALACYSEGASWREVADACAARMGLSR